MKLVAAVFTSLLVFGSAAQAGDCALDQYDHNGSVMDLMICDGGDLSISYSVPRSGIARQGVLHGTLLFDGLERPNGSIAGNARLFSRRCGEVAYVVSGRRVSASRIVLTGQAPRRNKKCQIVGYRNDRLVFTLRP